MGWWIFSDMMTIFELTNEDDYLCVIKNISQIFSTSLAKWKLLPFDFVLERDPKNILYYQRNVENYADLFLNILLFHKHEYTHGIFRFVILVSIFMLQVYVTFFVSQIWLTESILFLRENIFRGTSFLLASNTLRCNFFPAKINSLHWNGAAYTCKEKFRRKFTC